MERSSTTEEIKYCVVKEEQLKSTSHGQLLSLHRGELKEPIWKEEVGMRKQLSDYSRDRDEKVTTIDDFTARYHTVGSVYVDAYMYVYNVYICTCVFVGMCVYMTVWSLY